MVETAVFMGPGLVHRFVELRARALFWVAFAVLAVDAAVVGFENPLGPGLDQHYHVLNASIAARGWFGDRGIRELYALVNPLDANTLVYTWTAPFQLVLDPVRAYGVAFTLLYFVGYPLACAVALHLFRRPLWGALLAFPLCYVNTWGKAGYIPFDSAAPFFVLSLGALHRLLDDLSSEASKAKAPSRVTVALAVAAPILTLLAHAQGYLWCMAVLGFLTVLSLGRDLARIAVAPAETLLHVARKGGQTFLFVFPSLVLFLRWYWPALRAQAAGAGANVPQPPVSATPWQSKLSFFYASIVNVRDDADWRWAAILFVLVVLCLVLSSRPRGRALASPEIALGLSLASYWLLPEYVNGQSIGLRHVDFACWLVPLVVYAAPAPAGARLRGAVAVVAIFTFASLRSGFLAPYRAKLTREYAGLTKLGCPEVDRATGEPPPEVAYVNFGQYSQHWHAASLQQAHETYAAFCGLDTPVYDPGRYAFSLPVRYRRGLPAPITIVSDDARWFSRASLFKSFEYVLVRNWHPTSRDRLEVLKIAEEVRTHGEWALWRRKPAAAPSP